MQKKDFKSFIFMRNWSCIFFLQKTDMNLFTSEAQFDFDRFEKSWKKREKCKCLKLTKRKCSAFTARA